MRSFIAFAALCAVLGISPAIAEDAPSEDAVRIVADQAAKAFVFIIDDEPVAMIDKSGLHVVGEINYGRWITDTGSDGVRERIAVRSSTEASHE